MWDLSSLTRDRTRVPCIGRRILNHWTTREIPNLHFNKCLRWALVISGIWYPPSISRGGIWVLERGREFSRATQLMVEGWERPECLQKGPILFYWPWPNSRWQSWFCAVLATASLDCGLTLGVLVVSWAGKLDTRGQTEKSSTSYEAHSSQRKP